MVCTARGSTLVLREMFGVRKTPWGLFLTVTRALTDMYERCTGKKSVENMFLEKLSTTQFVRHYNTRMIDTNEYLRPRYTF